MFELIAGERHEKKNKGFMKNVSAVFFFKSDLSVLQRHKEMLWEPMETSILVQLSTPWESKIFLHL
jgi:hypothetical protein